MAVLTVSISAFVKSGFACLGEALLQETAKMPHKRAREINFNVLILI